LPYWPERAGAASESDWTEANAANVRRLAAIPSSKDNRMSQMEELPRSNTANAERRTGVRSSKQQKTRKNLRLLWVNAANYRGFAVLARGRDEMPLGFVHFGRVSSEILT
jgi:hypothetical protein